MKEVLAKLDEMQKESMELKLQIKDDVHNIDKRLTIIETRWKVITPAVALFFGVIGSYIKTLLGIKGQG